MLGGPKVQKKRVTGKNQRPHLLGNAGRIKQQRAINSAITKGQTEGLTTAGGAMLAVKVGQKKSTNSVTEMVISGKASNNRKVGISNGSSVLVLCSVTVVRFH